MIISVRKICAGVALVPLTLSFAAGATPRAIFSLEDINPFKSECTENQYKAAGMCWPKGKVFGLPDVPALGQIVPKEIKTLVDTLGVVPNVVPLAGAFLVTAETPDKQIKVLKDVTGDVISHVSEPGRSLLTTIQKGAGNAVASYEKGWRDISEQAKRSFADTVEAGEAVGRYTERQLKDTVAGLNRAEERVREGKFVDAMWGLAVEPLQATEKNFAAATQESQVIAAAAQSAAATYGGPAGASAYAAWSTYRTTGDADLALRAGILSAVTSQTGSMTPKVTDSVLKKAALAGAAGGIAVAAAGGDEKAITEAFLKSGGNVLVQAGTDKMKKEFPNAAEKIKEYSPKAAEAAQAVQCISARDLDCVSRIPYAQKQGKFLMENGEVKLGEKVKDATEYLGKWSKLPEKSELAKKYAFITDVSKLEDLEAIPLMDNEWVLTWTLGASETLKDNVPAVVLTYVGSNKPFISRVTYGDKDTIIPGTRPKSQLTSAELASAVRIHRGDDVVSFVPVDGEMRPTYRYSASLNLSSKDASAIKSVHYFFDADTFINPKLGTQNGDLFMTSWVGWGCAYKARVIATLTDGKKITGHFDMCTVASTY